MKNACEIITKQVSPMLHGRDVTLFKKLDDALKTFKEREEEDGDVKIGSNIIVAVS